MVVKARKGVRKSKRVVTPKKKRRPVSKNNKSTERIRKDFFEFAKKVEQLEMLSRELASLNTRGFETEERIIRAQLKNVDAIPSISKSLGDLKRKVKTREAEWKRMGGFVDSRFADFISSIKTEVGSRLKSDVMALEREFSKKYKLLVKEFHNKYQEEINKQLTKDVRTKFEAKLTERLAKEKAKLTSKLKKLNDAKLSKKVEELEAEAENLIKEKKRLTLRYKKLNDERLVKKIQQLEIETRRFKEKLGIRLRKINDKKLLRQADSLLIEAIRFETQLKQDLHRDFAARLRAEMKKSEVGLLKRKSALEKHIKRFLNKRL